MGSIPRPNPIDGHLALLETVDAASGQCPTIIGPPADSGPAHAVLASQTLDRALPQLVLDGHAGLPVISDDGHLQGWITHQNVLQSIADNLACEPSGAQGAVASSSGTVARRDAVTPARVQDRQPRRRSWPIVINRPQRAPESPSFGDGAGPPEDRATGG
jgi:hypothetical protein